MNDFIIQPAQPGDEKEIFRMIRELGEYENLSDRITGNADMLRHELFEKKSAEVICAKLGSEYIGYALFFTSFSTFLCRSGIYLEDLYISPHCRDKGYGRALFEAVREIASVRGAGRLEWSCLDWNEPSIKFYLSLGAKPQSDWTAYRISLS
ncbi:hypothetical protein SDC9_63082 [bioreactor metagenome]|uniref:N-acetyltransferase domain-containing protein n=1 Tax=bioreactor metagenome TaxID=1076179 RepID=A0A644XLK9_9ZZZZ|nr:GNAT family N-acetyltransferase [Oscillospiraceae bacterium]